MAEFSKFSEKEFEIYQIRKPAVAGMFYPSSKEELYLTVNQLLEEAKVKDYKFLPKALILPHAGYIYSGIVAAHGIKTIANQPIKRVILLGPSHHFSFQGIALDETKFWETPLGLVPLFEESFLLEKDIFKKSQEIHQPEHCLEVEIPFLQVALKNFKILPLLTGQVVPIEEAARAIKEILGKNSILIVSSDLSHYLPYQEAREIDEETINYILKKDLKGFLLNGEACGKLPIAILLQIAISSNWQPTLLAYANSGDTSGIKDQVVGYSAIAFH